MEKRVSVSPFHRQKRKLFLRNRVTGRSRASNAPLRTGWGARAALRPLLRLPVPGSASAPACPPLYLHGPGPPSPPLCLLPRGAQRLPLRSGTAGCGAVGLGRGAAPARPSRPPWDRPRQPGGEGRKEGSEGAGGARRFPFSFAGRLPA